MRSWYLVLPCAALLACATEIPSPSPPPGVRLSSMTVTSKSFTSAHDMPVDFSCDGADKPPHLEWSSPPDGTKSFAIVLDDSDASSFTHWVAFNVNPEARAIKEGGEDLGELGVRMGMNDFRRVGYSGPCPPRHEGHRYVFRVFALNAELPLSEGATKAALYGAMRGHVLAEGLLVGQFSH